MRLLHLSATFSIVALFVTACDDTVTGPYAQSDRSPPLSLNQEAPNESQPAPVDGSQDAPNSYQAAPVAYGQIPTADSQDPPSNGGGAAQSSALGRACVTYCNKFTALKCDDDIVDCDSECSEMAAELPPSCSSVMIAYMSCISAGCDLFESCALEVNGVSSCLKTDGASSSSGESVVSGTPTNSSGSCTTSNSCAGCTDVCDACLCTAQAAGLSTSAASSTCSTYCS